jgi:predicted metallopeptidase
MLNYGYLSVMIRYELAKDIGSKIEDIIHKLQMTHVDGSRVACIRSKGSKGKRVIARCHGLSRIMQLALNQKPQYVIEVVSERFDKLSTEEQTKVLIHELMHIPHSFGGGFRAHKPHVTRKKVERMYERLYRNLNSHTFT